MLKQIQAKDNVSLDNVCYLISETVSYDEIGNEVKTQAENMCWCAEASIYSSEFYRAGQQGIELSTVLIVDNESYNKEAQVKYNDNIYTVYRVYPRSDGMAELYLIAKAGD